MLNLNRLICMILLLWILHSTSLFYLDPHPLVMINEHGTSQKNSTTRDNFWLVIWWDFSWIKWKKVKEHSKLIRLTVTVVSQETKHFSRCKKKSFYHDVQQVRKTRNLTQGVEKKTNKTNSNQQHLISFRFRQCNNVTHYFKKIGLSIFSRICNTLNV